MYYRALFQFRGIDLIDRRMKQTVELEGRKQVPVKIRANFVVFKFVLMFPLSSLLNKDLIHARSFLYFNFSFYFASVMNKMIKFVKHKNKHYNNTWIG